MSGDPRVVWVFGPKTDIGKTTVTCALLRALGRYGMGTMGFKPLSAADVFRHVDALEARPEGALTDYDSGTFLPFCTAAPAELDEVAFNELMNPQRLLFFHAPSELLVVRSGSEQLGNREVFRGNGPSNALARPDVASLVERKRLLAGAQALPGDYGMERWHQFWPEKAQAAWSALCGLSPDIMVCEGGAHYLPVWPDQPVPDAILIVLPGDLLLLTGIDARVRSLAHLDTAPRMTDFQQLGRSVARHSWQALLPLAGSDRQAEVTEGVVEDLFRQAGWLPS